MYQHTSPINRIATAQGKQVLTAGYDNHVILWNADTRHSVNRVFHDHLANQYFQSLWEFYFYHEQ